MCISPLVDTSPMAVEVCMLVFSFSRCWWNRWWAGEPKARKRNRTVKRAPTAKLRLEPLEDRWLPSGTWVNLADSTPSSSGTMLLLSDGSVMMQRGGVSRGWLNLRPNADGSYLNGTWSQLASMNIGRLYYASNVLPDGRVFVVGGEFSGPSGSGNDTNTTEIYDPVANLWQNTASFPQAVFGDD